MAKTRRGNCKKYGRAKSGKCRKGPRASGRAASRLHKRGRKIGGEYKVACNGKRVYASTSESGARDAAKAASKRMGRCTIFTSKGRVANYQHGTSV